MLNASDMFCCLQLLTLSSAQRKVSSQCRLQLLVTASAQQNAVLRLIRNLIHCNCIPLSYDCYLWAFTGWAIQTTHITHIQQCYSSLDFVWDNPGELVPEEMFTHSHLSWSSIIPCLLPPSITIHSILPVRLTCLTVFFHNLYPGFLWSTSWPSTLNFILHVFLHPIIVFFSQHMPIPSQPVLL